MRRRLCAVLIAALLAPMFGIAAQAQETQQPVRVALIDSGVSVHPGRLDGEKILTGYNYVSNSEETEDGIGHGTRIAGLLLGTTDGVLPGTCPEAQLVPLVYTTRAFPGDTKNGGIPAIAKAMEDAVDVWDCQIILVCSGVTQPDEMLARAAVYAEEQGALVIAAAGNGNLLAPEYSYYPAAYDTVLGVGAASGEEVAPFSTRGRGVSLLAPGTKELALNIRTDKYSEVSGTSYAVAYAAGAAVKLLSANPALTPAQVRDILTQSARDMGPAGWDEDFGWGILDETAALARLKKSPSSMSTSAQPTD